MQLDDIRFLFGFDRWATTKVLDAAASVDAETWSATNIVAERRHTQYDPDLGWVNEPNIDIPDMYGPGIYLRTNSQGFRNNHDISPAVPAGKARIISLSARVTRLRLAMESIMIMLGAICFPCWIQGSKQ